MKTVADFRRTACVGSRWQCDNLLHPHVSGERVITASGPKVVLYIGTKADGSQISNGRMEWPKAAACRVDGDAVQFLAEPGSDRVAYTWTLLPEEASR